MNPSLIVFAMLAAVTGCGPSEAQATDRAKPDWQFVNEGRNNGSRWYIDANSVVSAGIYRAATVKVLHGGYAPGSYGIQENSYDCVNRTMTQLAWTEYGADGKVITSLKFKPTEHSAGKPEVGTIGESVLDAVCQS